MNCSMMANAEVSVNDHDDPNPSMNHGARSHWFSSRMSSRNLMSRPWLMQGEGSEMVGSLIGRHLGRGGQE